MRGSVAQLVEQRTENPCVGGSNPPRTTSKPRFQAGFFIESDGNYLCQIMNEVKCPSCNTWYNKQLQACSACSHILPVHDTFAPQNDHRTIKPFEMPLPSWNTKAKKPLSQICHQHPRCWPVVCHADSCVPCLHGLLGCHLKLKITVFAATAALLVHQVVLGVNFR